MPSLTHGLVSRRTLLVLGGALIVLPWPACGDQSKTLEQDILNRTIPPGEPALSPPEPVRSSQSLQFTWDIETRMSPADYSAWLTAQLRDFQLVDANDSDLHFAKAVGGDAYRVHVTLQSGLAVTRVRVQLTASPD